jgi:rhamnogalacturonyl hydrolase YesR
MAVHSSIQGMLERAIASGPREINTDWDGTLLIAALLAWHEATGERRYKDFAIAWFEYHKEHDHTLSEEHYYATFTGIHSKIIRQGPIPFTAYCGHWGLGYACGGLSLATDDPAVAATADAVADYILHHAARSPHGCVYHDDDADFLIPDTCYFAAPVLAIAARLTGKSQYEEHAIRQLKAYTELMQDGETGLAFTLWSRQGMPRNFWSRASGWLAGALINTLEQLPQGHGDYEWIVERYKRLAAAIVRHQRADGGFHVLLDRPDLPADCTAPAMMAMALAKGVHLGVLEQHYRLAAERAWEACRRFVTEDGLPTGAYTGWAKTAVAEDFTDSQFAAPRDFVSGLILLAAPHFEVVHRSVQK